MFNKISNRINIEQGQITLSLHPEDCVLLARACEEVDLVGGDPVQAEMYAACLRAWSTALTAAGIAALSPVVQPEDNDPVWQFCVLPGEEVSQE